MLGQAIFAVEGGPVLSRARGQDYDLALRFHQFGDRKATSAQNGVSSKLLHNACVP
jgi:hypothetical protein